MLLQLRIVDFAIIEGVELALAPGLNVLSGETGAGKSMIVGAASLLRGGRASAEIVRKGSKEAVVEALFGLDGQPRAQAMLDELGLPAGDGELLVRRVVPRNGRGRIWVNGSLCTAAVLARLMGGLLDISGQHEYQSLGDRAVQLELLDALAVQPAQRTAMASAYQKLGELAQALERTQLDDRRRVERIDFLQFQLRELEAAKLELGEDEQLETRVARLRRASDLAEASAQAERELYGQDRSLCQRIAALHRRIVDLEHLDPVLVPLAAQLEEGRVLLEDAAFSLGRYAAGIEQDPQSLETTEARLDLLRRLQRKHGGSLEEVLARQQAMRSELDELASLDLRRDELHQQLAAAQDEARKVAGRLTTARRRGARQLAAGINAKLGELGMKGATFDVALEPRAEREGVPAAFLLRDGKVTRRVGASGWDRVEFVVATNLGEDARPLGRIASGGELSRLMLALRQVLGQHAPAGTSVFDEVDAGIGGAVADVVGQSLAQVARHRQVLVVTHLPQVAAYAQRHFRVGKGTVARGTKGGPRTTTTLRALDDAERTEELARMLAGSRVTEAARANARQLFSAAEAARAAAAK